MMGEDTARRDEATAQEGEGAESVVVLFGGPSAEHDVSVVSGWAIADSLAGSGLDVERFFIDLRGRWWRVRETAVAGRPHAGVFDDPGATGAEGPWSPAEALGRLAARAARPLVFVALHGPFGEDGTVQALLEAYDLPYTGAGVAGSAIGMDKAVFKRLVGGIGLPIVPWIQVESGRWRVDRDSVLSEIDAFARRTGEPRLMVKPSRLGSSVGMTLAHAAGERAAALDTAFGYDTVAIVEQYLDHPRELEVAIVGNEPDALRSFGPGEVFPGREFYDYVAKYGAGVSRTVPLAELDPAFAASVRAMAEKAYAAIGCEGFARMDFLLDGDRVYVSEINTIPGFTPISLFPQMAASGLGSFAAVCVRIVELARERHAARVRAALTPADLPR
jgi:D-alanine-D-alanine ligase